MTGRCFFLSLTFVFCKANTISLVRRKNPVSRFQLMPHLQCCKPINCCFIFLPQLGHILLFFPIPCSPDDFHFIVLNSIIPFLEPFLKKIFWIPIFQPLKHDISERVWLKSFSLSMNLDNFITCPDGYLV